MKDEKPREYPETLEGQAAFDRFRALTQRLVNVPREKVREAKDDKQPS